MIRIVCALVALGSIEARAAWSRPENRQSALCMALLSAAQPRGEFGSGVLIDHRGENEADLQKFFSRLRVARAELVRQVRVDRKRRGRSKLLDAHRSLGGPAAVLALLSNALLVSSLPFEPAFATAGLGATLVLGGIDYPLRHFRVSTAEYEDLLETFEAFQSGAIEGATWATRLTLPLRFIEKIRDLSRPDWSVARRQNLAEELAGVWRLVFPKMNANPQRVDVEVRLYKENGEKKMIARMTYAPLN